jgi:TonB-linked SusC/RagA family outer membrane protein
MSKNPIFMVGLLLLSIQLLAQNRTITGKVNDAFGSPVAGASVQVKGTGNGTVTKDGGTFSLSVPANSTLTISAVNHHTQELAIGDQTIYTITLQAGSQQSMDEVVVVGYTSINRRSLTGSVSKVQAGEIENRPVTSFDQALTGKAAGLQVNTSSGLIGDNVIIRIRGAASLGSSSQPLFVIDGTPVVQGNAGQLYNPVNALSDLNPNDIESVEVLKDASASAIYGSRAAAGVILITTKKGKAGQNKLTYDGYYGITQVSKKLNILNAEQYATNINKMRSNAGLGNVIASGDFNGDGKNDETDWQKEVFHSGKTHNQNISLSGGTSRLSFYGSVSYLDFENYIINNRLRRGSLRLNTTLKATGWLTFGINSQYSRGFQYGLGSGTGAAASGIPVGPLRYYPNVPVRDANGNFYVGQGNNGLTVGSIPNPVAPLLANFDNVDTRRLITSGYAEATIIRGLKFKTQFGVDYRQGYTTQWWSNEFGDGQGLGGVKQNVNDENRNWNWFNTLNYSTRFGRHEITALAGTEYTKRMSSFNYLFGLGINDRSLMLISSNNYRTVGASQGFDENALASYFGNVGYSFANKYFLTGNLRADAYSGFGKNSLTGYFPGASVGWRISEEDFFHGLRKRVNELKLRGGYGITGNNNIGSYTAFPSYTSVGYAELTPANALNNPGNQDLRWERSSQLNIGMDIGLLNSRISIATDWYKKKSIDLVLANPVLASLGFPGNSITENIGQIQSHGFELSVQSDNIRSRNFTWSTNFNFAYNQNKVTATNSLNNDLFGGSSIARPGQPLGAYYLIRWVGVNPETGWAMFLDANGNKKMFNPSAPAPSRWTDEKGSSVVSAITANDRVVLSDKTPYPKYYGGMTNNFSFRGIDLSFDLQYALGVWIYNQTLQGLMGYTSVTNKSTDILNAWSAPGQATDVPKLYWNDNQWSQTSTRWLEKGDFVRIRNVQLGYNLPKSLLSGAKFTNLRLYAQVQNLYTFTGYKGIDPEANANGNTNIGLGIDNNRPYLPRTITFGLNLGL